MYAPMRCGLDFLAIGGNADMTARAKRNRRTLTLVLLACLAVSLICVVYPIYVIRPFRHQGARELAVALVVARFRAVTTVVAALTAVLATIGHWRTQPLKWRRAGSAAGAALAIVLAFLARVNIYELMFHPLIRPSFTAAGNVKLDGAEMGIAVRVGGEARRYPL